MGTRRLSHAAGFLKRASADPHLGNVLNSRPRRG
jgi:hypothetical protein